MNEDMGAWKMLYRGIGAVTRAFPNKGAARIDALIFFLAGHYVVGGFLIGETERLLAKVPKFERFCVLSDVNIGDAIFAQALAAKLRELFPDATIDTVVGKGAMPLMRHGKDASRVHSLYTTAPFPCATDIDAVNRLLSAESYDVILNFCPFLDEKKLVVPKGSASLPYLTAGAFIMREQANPEGLSNIVAVFQEYVVRFFGKYASGKNLSKEPNAYVTLSSESVEQVDRFLSGAAVDLSRPLVLYNPDTSSEFSRMPLALQVDLVRNLAKEPVTVLLGSGHAAPGIEIQILDALDSSERGNVTVVPKSVPLDAYAALIDRCDVFVTGDTGPLHIGAAEKRSAAPDYSTRNRTVVVSIFGATPSRIYGYASRRAGYLPAFQDAPSFTFANDSRMRTLLYLNKNFIMTKNPAIFFDGIKAEQIIDAVRSGLSGR